MKHAAALLLSAILVSAAGATVLAHVVTYKGTVMTVEPGKIGKVKVNVVNAQTRKATAMVFGIDDETKIFRGEVAVTFAGARIEKGETISVTLDIDDSNTVADVVRLAVKK